MVARWLSSKRRLYNIMEYKMTCRATVRMRQTSWSLKKTHFGYYNEYCIILIRKAKACFLIRCAVFILMHPCCQCNCKIQVLIAPVSSYSSQDPTWDPSQMECSLMRLGMVPYCHSHLCLCSSHSDRVKHFGPVKTARHFGCKHIDLPQIWEFDSVIWLD